MRVCCRTMPPETTVGERHTASCWLLSGEGLTAEDREPVSYEKEVAGDE